MESGDKNKILIIDDNLNNLFALNGIIKKYIDANILEANSVDEALQILNDQIIDLVILDVSMDDMNGFQLASIIKRGKRTQNIPMILLTTECITDELKKRGFEVGDIDYLIKPIDEYQLISRINVYLRLVENERSMNKILEQKVYEKTKELIKAKEEAIAANEAKSIFMANISHELRTPLNILLSSTQLIKSYLDSNNTLDRNKLRQKINIQIQNGYRLLRLINNIIDITKIDTGNFELLFRTCNIIKVIEDITLSVTEYANTKGIKILFDTDIEEKHINCDLDAIERILLNLLSNAIKFTPEGGSIFVTVKDMGKDIRISIKDTGIGIQEDKLDIIFKRFKQADNGLTREREGSGIGLSIVKALVEMHKGQIYVKSKYMHGSEFIVELPCDIAPQCEIGIINNDISVDDNSVIRKVNIEFSDIYY
mgnify:CR=1 FL=1